MFGDIVSPEEAVEIRAARGMAGDGVEHTRAFDTHTGMDAAAVGGSSMMPEGMAEMRTASYGTADGPPPPMVGIPMSDEERAEMEALLKESNRQEHEVTLPECILRAFPTPSPGKDLPTTENSIVPSVPSQYNPLTDIVRKSTSRSRPPASCSSC